MIYFIQEDKQNGRIKIGYTSRNPEKRLSALQTGNPDKLVLLGTMKGDQRTERVLHKQLAQYNTSGEWFSPSREVLWLVDDLLGGDISFCSYHKKSEAHQEQHIKTSLIITLFIVAYCIVMLIVMFMSDSPVAAAIFGAGLAASMFSLLLKVLSDLAKRADATTS